MRFRFGQVLARTEATLSGFRLVRNLSEPHVRPSRLPNALISIEFWLAVAASALPSGNVPVRAQKCGIEMPTEHFNVRNLAKPHARHARIPVNGNLFGSISTHRRYPTARDPCFAQVSRSPNAFARRRIVAL